MGEVHDNHDDGDDDDDNDVDDDDLDDDDLDDDLDDDDDGEVNLDRPVGEMHDDRLGRPDPALDLRNGAGRRCPDESRTIASSPLASVCQVLVHVLGSKALSKQCI